MPKKLIAFNTIISVFLSTGVVLATPPTFQTVTVAPAGHQISIPEQALQVADNVFDLGVGSDPVSGDPIQGYAIVHYKRGTAGKSAASHQNGGSTTCYTYIARNIKWKSVENWVVNPAGSNLDDAGVLSVVTNGIAKWEDAADGVVGNSVGYNILGGGALTSDSLAAGTYNLTNEVEFALLSEGTIAVTYVWYNLFTKAFVEWDQIYNTFYPWSLSGAANAMDFDDIATHELGHSVGMGDLYKSTCLEETMFGYADYGETKKRDLNTGDIAGVNKLY